MAVILGPNGHVSKIAGLNKCGNDLHTLTSYIFSGGQNSQPP